MTPGDRLTPKGRPDSSTLRVGDRLAERSYEPTNVSLFLYNAAIWNAHRIHYDERYTREVEKHPSVVIDGPLQGDWLTQAVKEWMVDGDSMLEFEYSNRRACHLGDRLTVSGELAEIDAETQEITLGLWVKTEDGEVTTPGRAIVRLGPPEPSSAVPGSGETDSE
jgi:hydroxyacyl-ACP dehydratase HTD2-like protein with hotdog domain